jgi:CubicO group peptidase (beta-lactamase class C family)
MALWLAGVAQFASAVEPDFSQHVAELAAPLVDNELVVGMSVGVLRDGQMETAAFGRLSAESDARPDERTLYEIGSVSKVFTAVLLAERVIAGEMALDDPVQKYLPDHVTLPAFEEQPIRLVDLATHTSGLPRMPDNFAPGDPRNPYADYDAKLLYAFLSGHTLARAPGSQYEYSNLAMGLLGHVLERQAGRDYDALLRDRIAEPLAMADTSIALSEDQRARLAPGHDADGAPYPNWDLGALAGAGAIRSTTADLLKFLAANLDPPEGPLGDALRLVQEPRHDIAPGAGQIALGWHVAGDGFSRMHSGQTGGYHSICIFNPRTKVGVVVLTNTATGEVDAFAANLLRLAGGYPLQPQAIRTIVKVPAETLEKYVGRYSLAPGIVFDITCEEDRLYAQLTGQERFRVYPESDTEFYYRVVEAQLTFVLGDDGTVARLVLPQNGQDVEAPRIME